MVTFEKNTQPLEVVPFKTLEGGTVAWASCVRNPRVVEKKHEKGRAYARDGHKPQDGAALVIAEKSNGIVTGRYLIDKEITGCEHRIPVVYPPDSALPMAEGFMTACKQKGVEATLYTATGTQDTQDVRSWAKYSHAIPPAAIEEGRKAGVIVICEGTIDRGHTIRSLLNSIPDDFNGKVLIAASREIVGNSNFIADNIIMQSDFMKTLSDINSRHTPKQFSVKLFVSERTSNFVDQRLPDLGDTILAIHQEGSEGVRSMAERLTKRKPAKPDGPNKF